ncbi:spore germination protein [Bacillus sp. BRMEA1]|uniref:spore germination protein n=1 Tax=Neobacillus endophyticus TaxID=2738405 RepID=UPI001564337E|nr:spore germination protein [Neobacillus endophyticus]NRD76561.1 spore germination protein [Neobacillus endophyticus]
MPAIINGPLTIESVTTNGIVKFGDVSFITPKTASKTHLGSGGGNTGGAVVTNTIGSATNYMDINVIDQPIIRNN